MPVSLLLKRFTAETPMTGRNQLNNRILGSPRMKNAVHAFGIVKAIADTFHPALRKPKQTRDRALSLAMVTSKKP